MTLIAISCQSDGAQILTDTAAYTPNLRHLHTTTKTSFLHHLDAAIVAGGLPAFAAEARFAAAVDDSTAYVDDFDRYVQAMPDLLGRLFRAHLRDHGPSKSPAVIFLVGHSERHGRFVAYELASDNDFCLEEMSGTYLHPTPWHLRPSEREYRLLLQAYTELGAHPDLITDIRDNWLTKPPPEPNITPDALIQLAKDTREDRSMGGGIPIHGDLIHTSLRQGRVITRKVHTFPTSGPNFARFIDGTDHPLAQQADCPCGSGLNVVICCRAGDLMKPCRCRSGVPFGECCMLRLGGRAS